MYIEELNIHNYEQHFDIWLNTPEEERGPEPEMPLVLQEREESQVAPDIMDLLEGADW